MYTFYVCVYASILHSILATSPLSNGSNKYNRDNTNETNIIQPHVSLCYPPLARNPILGGQIFTFFS